MSLFATSGMRAQVSAYQNSPTCEVLKTYFQLFQVLLHVNLIRVQGNRINGRITFGRTLALKDFKTLIRWTSVQTGAALLLLRMHLLIYFVLGVVSSKVREIQAKLEMISAPERGSLCCLQQHCYH